MLIVMRLLEIFWKNALRMVIFLITVPPMSRSGYRLGFLGVWGECWMVVMLRVVWMRVGMLI